MPIWFFTKAVYDDVLMINYSHLNLHFHNWNIQSLSKDISYSIFLFLVRISHVSYRFWLSLLWIIAAIVVIYGIYKFLTKDKKIILFSFLFILFSPVAFDVICGQRIYRNAIITPVTIIFLSVLYIFINYLQDSTKNIQNTIFWGIVLGLIFTFNFYIKEDGILTLPIILVGIFAVLICKLLNEKKISFSRTNFKKGFKFIIIGFIPLLIFIGGTVGYQEINYHYFGVSEINTRTSGELGEFYSILLKIDDDNKTNEIWVPASTVEQACYASPTLKSQPEFLNSWLDTPWNGGTLRDSEIRGDLVAWSLRQSLHEVGLFNNEKSANDFFFKVNKELNNAFDNGTLNQSNKIFITSSANGKSVDEIFSLKDYFVLGTKMTLFFDGFEFNNINMNTTSYFISDEVTKNVSDDLNDKIITQYEFDNLSTLDKIPIKLINLDLMLYQILSYCFVIFSFLSFCVLCVYQSMNKLKNSTINTLILFNIMLIGTVLVQIFAIVWFCSYLGHNPWIGQMDDLSTHIKFHLVSAYGFFSMFVVLSIAGLNSIKDKIRLRKSGKFII